MFPVSVSRPCLRFWVTETGNSRRRRAGKLVASVVAQDAAGLGQSVEQLAEGAGAHAAGPAELGAGERLGGLSQHREDALREIREGRGIGSDLAGVDDAQGEGVGLGVQLERERFG